MASSARLEELTRKFDENPRRYFAPLANEYRKLGDLSQAIALCRAHLPNQPGHLSGHVVLGQALFETHELAESRSIFEQALELDPENLIALRTLGDIASAQGQPSIARGWYERLLEVDPRNDAVANLLREIAASASATESAAVVETQAPSQEVAADAPRSMAWDPDRTPISNVAVPACDAHVLGSDRADLTDAMAGDFATDTSSRPDARYDEREYADGASTLAEPPTDVGADGVVAEAEFIGYDAVDVEPTSGVGEDEAPSADFPTFEEDGAAFAVEQSMGATGAQPDDWFSAPTPAHGAAVVPESPHLESDEPATGTLTVPTVPTGAEPGSTTVDFEMFDLVEKGDAAGIPPSSVADEPEVPAEAKVATPELYDDWFAALSAKDQSPSDAECAPDLPEPVVESAPRLDDALDEPIDSPDIGVSTIAHAVASESLAELSNDAAASGGTMTADGTEATVADAVYDLAARSEPVDLGDEDAPAASAELRVAEDSADTGAADWSHDVVQEAAEALDGESCENVLLSEIVAGPSVATEPELAIAAPDPDSHAELHAAVDASADAAAHEVPPIVVLEDEGTPREIDCGIVGSGGVGAEFSEAASGYRAPLESTNGEASTTPELDLAYEGNGHADPPWEHADLPAPEAADASELTDITAEEWAAITEPSSVAANRHETACEVASERIQDPEEPASDLQVVATTGSSQALDGDFGEGALPEMFVTETMAELYLQQGFVSEALQVYRKLSARSPWDESLRARVADLERAPGKVGPLPALDRSAQSVRVFFGRIARRQPARRQSGSALDVASLGAQVANRQGVEVTTVEHAAPTLNELFAEARPEVADDAAARRLASALGSAEGAGRPARVAESELSLDHLFRDVPSGSSDAVTLDAFFAAQGGAGSEASGSDQGPDEEAQSGDIEQFTAWLEGLKKK
ncbi:MAG: hypothetical protein MNPFHGCM_02843 [Gemmatimonadaceae bacterium]|nr:hypothetical protein [Gemmatimonadaceae bacterium]